jgi:hypothetical protein
LPRASKKANNLIPLYYQLQPAVNKAMDRELERYIITGLVLILLVLGISGCGVKNVQVQQPEEKEQISQPMISNLEGIAFVLGCMFDPAPCQEKKELGKTEEGK